MQKTISITYSEDDVREIIRAHAAKAHFGSDIALAHVTVEIKPGQYANGYRGAIPASIKVQVNAPQPAEKVRTGDNVRND